MGIHPDVAELSLAAANGTIAPIRPGSYLSKYSSGHHNEKIFELHSPVPAATGRGSARFSTFEIGVKITRLGQVEIFYPNAEGAARPNDQLTKKYAGLFNGVNAPNFYDRTDILESGLLKILGELQVQPHPAASLQPH